jgi:hypothetical protein
VVLAVAGVLALTGVAFAASSGQYGGTTSQKLGGTAFRITLNVSRDGVSEVQMQALVHQGAGICTIVDSLNLDFKNVRLKIDPHGKFSGKLKDGLGDGVTIKGVFKGDAVSGSFVVAATGAIQGTHVCTSGSDTFTARLGGGQAKNTKYSGTIGPGYPISFRVSANGSAVDGLVLGFDETCNGAPGNTAPLFHFKTLGIKSGQFSGGSSDQFGPTVSDSLRITGTFFGRVAVGQISDTSRIKSLPTCTQTEPFMATAK